jgi:hypothetical protein
VILLHQLKTLNGGVLNGATSQHDEADLFWSVKSKAASGKSR